VLDWPIISTMDSSLYKTFELSRKRLVEMHCKSQVGHLGSNLSCIDILLTLFHTSLNLSKDNFILSKGHSAGALYVCLWSLGILTSEDLDSFHQDNTNLAAHPVPSLTPAIPFATGSLGHGLPIALGIAMANKIQKNYASQVYCLTSDGEWQEGSMWEALITASHQSLSNLSILIDLNGYQGFGSTDEVASMSNLFKRLLSFNVAIQQCSGHNPSEIHKCIVNRSTEKPNVIIFNTVKGNGIPRLQSNLDGHYLPPNESELAMYNPSY